MFKAIFAGALIACMAILGFALLLLAMFLPSLVLGLAVWVIAPFLGATIGYWKAVLLSWAVTVVVSTIFRLAK